MKHHGSQAEITENDTKADAQLVEQALAADFEIK